MTPQNHPGTGSLVGGIGTTVAGLVGVLWNGISSSAESIAPLAVALGGAIWTLSWFSAAAWRYWQDVQTKARHDATIAELRTEIEAAQLRAQLIQGSGPLPDRPPDRDPDAGGNAPGSVGPLPAPSND